MEVRGSGGGSCTCGRGPGGGKIPGAFCSPDKAKPVTSDSAHLETAGKGLHRSTCVHWSILVPGVLIATRKYCFTAFMIDGSTVQLELRSTGVHLYCVFRVIYILVTASSIFVKFADLIPIFQLFKQVFQTFRLLTKESLFLWFFFFFLVFRVRSEFSKY